MITMKQHDTIPQLSVTLSDDGQVVDVSVATTIKVIAVRAGTPVFSRTVSGTSLGVVTMDWQPADTAVPGILELEIEVDWPAASAVQTFPASGRLRVNIEPDLG